MQPTLLKVGQVDGARKEKGWRGAPQNQNLEALCLITCWSAAVYQTTLSSGNVRATHGVSPLSFVFMHSSSSACAGDGSRVVLELISAANSRTAVGAHEGHTHTCGQ